VFPELGDLGTEDSARAVPGVADDRRAVLRRYHSTVGDDRGAHEPPGYVDCRQPRGDPVRAGVGTPVRVGHHLWRAGLPGLGVRRGGFYVWPAGYAASGVVSDS